MKLPHGNFFAGIPLIILALFGCQSQQEPPGHAQKLQADFYAVSLSDTLKVGLDSIPHDSSKEISAQLFIASMDSALIRELIYEADTFDFRARAYWKIPLDENTDACLIGIRQQWFHFKYMLVYDKSSRRFMHIEPLAYLYGGDGGQIMSESWVYDLQTQPTILSRYLSIPFDGLKAILMNPKM